MNLHLKISPGEIHASIIFLYIAQLINQRDFPKYDSKKLSETYKNLSSIFNVSLAPIETFDSAENLGIGDLYSPLQLGYVIDICHQFHLSNRANDEDTETTFNKASGYRKMRGAFFTPYEIARLICHRSISQSSQNGISTPKILDMGCGTGVFACAAAHELLDCGIEPGKILAELIYGIDVEPLSALVTKALIQAELQISIDKFTNLDSIKTQDILFGNLDYGLFSGEIDFPKFDAIVMNPPYDRLKADGGDSSEKALVEAKIKFVKESPIFQNSSSGSIDLYRLFIEKGLSMLSPFGVIGAIIPATFLADKSASKLRKQFLDKKSISELILYPEKAKIFENVTQACSIFIANLKVKSPSIKITTMSSLEKVGSEIKVPLSIALSTSPNYLPIPVVDKRGLLLLEKLNQYPRICDIKGIQNKRGELDLTLDKSFLDGHNTCLLKGVSVSAFRFDKVFNVDFDSFIKAKATSSRVNDIAQPRIAGQQISNLGSSQRLKFCFVPKNYLLGNSLNYLSVDSSLFKNSFNLFTLLGFLNSSLLNWRFKLTSSNNHVNNYEIDDLPIPIGAPEAKIKKINMIVEKIIGISTTEEINKDLISELNNAVFECFDLTPEDL